MKYSIITINYNNRDGLRRTIESVVNQTCQDFEYIIIDGGSTDGSVEVIKEYADRIDYWVSEPDKGIYNAMNKGILQAHGEYLNFMNSGDCFYDEKVLENVFSKLDKDLIVGKMTYLNNTFREHKKSTITMYDFIHGTLPHQASFFRRELFSNNHLYDENFRIVSDWKFYIECLIFENCTYRIIDLIVCDFDTNGIGTTNSELNKVERVKVLETMLPSRILDDYYEFWRTDSYLRELAPEFNHTYRFQKMLYFIVKFLVKCKEKLRV